MWKIHASCSVGWLLVKQLVSNNFLLYLLCAILKAKLCNPLDCWKARLHGRKKWRAVCMCYKRYSVIHCRYIILWLIAIELEAIHILIFDRLHCSLKVIIPARNISIENWLFHNSIVQSPTTENTPVAFPWIPFKVFIKRGKCTKFNDC